MVYINIYIMKLTKDKYIEENLKLSSKNSYIMLNSLERNFKNIITITHNIQKSQDKVECISELTKIKDLSIQSIMEKCNSLKAAIDRCTISYEDTNIPKMIKYVRIRNLHPRPIPNLSQNKRFKDKMTQSTMPLPPSVVMVDDGDDYID
jgi:hypothetical protein